MSCELPDTMVLLSTGWAKASRIIRHRLSKPLLRVHTNVRGVNITSDHSMLCQGSVTSNLPLRWTRWRMSDHQFVMFANTVMLGNVTFVGTYCTSNLIYSVSVPLRVRWPHSEN